jgi:hypothetical protein
VKLGIVKLLQSSIRLLLSMVKERVRLDIRG